MYTSAVKSFGLYISSHSKESSGCNLPPNPDCKHITPQLCEAHDGFRRECPEACGLCQCDDRGDNCKGITPPACRILPELRTSCAKSCGVCENPTTTTKPTGETHSCNNAQTWCKFIAKEHCDEEENKRNCPAQCVKECQGETLSCKDTQTWCQFIDKEHCDEEDNKNKCPGQCVKECQVDCMWGDWKDTTGRCSKTCGVGLDAGRKEQRREIIQRNENGGNACGNKDTRYVNCNARKCPVNCKWASWTETACSATCGTDAMKDRRRNKLILASNGGKECAGGDFERVLCNLNPCSGMKVLVVGGSSKSVDYLNDVELVDPMDPNTNCVKPMAYPRKARGMTGQLIANTPIVCGGAIDGSSSSSVLRSCYAYNKNNRWEERSGLIKARYSMPSVITNKTIWIVGGIGNRSHDSSSLTTSEMMSLETGKFNLDVALPEKMYGHCTVTINVTHIFIASNSYNGKMAYIVDTTTSPFQFTYIGPLLKKREGSACGVAAIGPSKDLHLIVAGGYDGGSRTNSEMYSLGEEVWKIGPNLPRGFWYGGTISNNEHPLMLIGGYDENYNERGDIMDYDAESNSFKTLHGKLKTPTYQFAVIAIEETC